MVTIYFRRTKDYDKRPELDQIRQTFNLIENVIANHHDTPNIGSFAGSSLAMNASRMKLSNLNARKFEESETEEEGNLVLETRLIIGTNYLILNIDLRDIGVVQGRGSYELVATENGFCLQAQEFDCYKNSGTEEAHAIKRNIVRVYQVKGFYDWKNMTNTLTPNGILHIVVYCKNHPLQMEFPSFERERIYSSWPERRPVFPPSDPCQTFGSYFGLGNLPRSKCFVCGGVKSVGVQTGSSLTLLPTQSNFCPPSGETLTSNFLTAPSIASLPYRFTSQHQEDVYICKCSKCEF